MNCLLVGLLWLGQGESLRTIPPMSCELRTGPELAIFSHQVSELEGQLDRLGRKIRQIREAGGDTSLLDGRQARLQGQYDQLAGRSDPEASRLHHEIFVPAKERFEQEFTSSQAWTAERADDLLDQLYVDLGHPSLNYRFARIGIDRINSLTAKQSDLNPTIRQHFLTGLAEYAENGLEGGLFPSATLKSDLAEALIRVGGEESYARELAHQLVAEAVAQSTALGRLDDVKSIREQFQFVPSLSSALVSPTVIGRSESAATDCDYEAVGELFYNFLRQAPDSVEQQEKAIQEFLKFLRVELVKSRVNKAILSVSETCLGRIFVYLNDRAKEDLSLELWVGTVKTLGKQASEEFRAFVKNERKEVQSEKLGKVLDELVKSWGD